jgi:hypothetical protein
VPPASVRNDTEKLGSFEKEHDRCRHPDQIIAPEREAPGFRGTKWLPGTLETQRKG